MGRPSKAWHWKARNGWYATVRGERRRLGDDKATAERELHRLLAEVPGEPRPFRDSGPTVAEIADRFHDHAKETLAEATIELYARRLAEFKLGYGGTLASDLKPLHVQEWVASHDWGPGTRRTAIGIVKRAFAWATRQGHLERDPILATQKPPAPQRRKMPETSDILKVIDAVTSDRFREFITAVRLSGCRPGEAAKVTAKDFNSASKTWTIHGKTTRRTGKMRVVYLPGELVELCNRLAAENPTGPLFLNSYGKPWGTHAYGEQVRRIRRRLELDDSIVAYSLRHLFATDALEDGMPIATVAELLGHSSTAMVSQVYSHLSDRASHLREAVEKVRGVSPSAGDASGRIVPDEPEQPPSPSAPAAAAPRRRRGRTA